jgi:AraC-like DNA-binding protein
MGDDDRTHGRSGHSPTGDHDQTYRERRPSPTGDHDQTYRKRRPSPTGDHDQTYRERRPSPTGDHDQTYRERRPSRELAPYLSAVWIQEVAPGAEPYTHRTVPNGGIELACRIGAMPRLAGPQTGPTEDVLEPGAVVVGIRFRPGAAPSVLGLPATELVDLGLGAEELWGGRAAALGERVAEAATPQNALRLLEAEVAALLAAGASGPPDPIAVEAVQRLLPWRGADVGSLPLSLHISERQLRRRFQAAIGFAPKVLQRMLRFQGFLALAQGLDHAPDNLARLAAEAGYADQSHLTRESVRLAGRAPRELLRESERNCRSAHDHTPSYGPLLVRARTPTIA